MSAVLPGDGATSLALVAAAGAIGLAGTWLTRRYALRRNLLDRPNERSSHTVPTPRGGGIAIVAGFCAALLAWAALGNAPQAATLAAALLPASLLTAGMGFWDDHRPLPARARLVAHFAAAGWAVAILGPVQSLPWPGATIGLGVAGTVLTVVAVVWILNLCNFMDGIDGIAGSEAVFVALAAAALGAPDSPAKVPLLMLATASAGFLAFNWPPAKIFMGDVGSGFLGLALAALLLAQHAHGGLPIAAAVILLGVFVCDATVTLLVRLLRGERVHEAHRSHAYQRLARRFGSHRAVTLGALAIDLLWLLPMAALAARHPEWSIPVAALALAPLAAAALLAGAGRPDGQAQRPSGS